MKKNAKRAVPSKATFASADSVLQWLREKARQEDRRSDAQHYADTQWMMRHDMLAMGVPEATAMRWHNAVWQLKSHAENMAECIESQVGGSQRARDAAMIARKVMAAMRPNDRLHGREWSEAE